MDGGKGIDINQNYIPLEEQVNGACEMLGLDPMYVANEGLFIAIISPAIAKDFVSMLRNDENGKQASIIGNISTEHIGKVVMKSSIGGKRIVNMLPGEQLPRIC